MSKSRRRIKVEDEGVEKTWVRDYSSNRKRVKHDLHMLARECELMELDEEYVELFEELNYDLV